MTSSTTYQIRYYKAGGYAIGLSMWDAPMPDGTIWPRQKRTILRNQKEMARWVYGKKGIALNDISEIAHKLPA
jgi:ribulose bisphosphate carboxylase small subunit